MRKIIILLQVFIISNTFSQSPLILQPGPLAGNDTRLHELYPNINYENSPDLISFDWSFSGTEALGYSLLQFDLSALPSGVRITTATLSLYHNPVSRSAGQAGNNACYLKKITSPWDKNIVTWSTMPSTTSINQVQLVTSVFTNQDYPNINITNFVTDWYLNPQSNHGMMLEIIDKSLLNSMKFCSSDYLDSLRRPKLVICYSMVNKIDENFEKDSFGISVYPNPNNGIFAIKLWGDKMYGSKSVLVYSSTGKLVFHEEMKIFTNNPSKTFNLNSVSPGIYLVKVLGSSGAMTRKIIVR